MHAVAKFKRHSRSLSANSVESMTHDEKTTLQKLQVGKKFKVQEKDKSDGLLLPSDNSDQQVINIMSQDGNHYEQYLLIVVKSRGRTRSPSLMT
jgi:GTPase SAR1 family protein